MKAIIVGPDRGLSAALRANNVNVTAITGEGTTAALNNAGVEKATFLVVTNVDESTVIPIAKDLNPGIRVLVYSPITMPDFVRGQVDLALTPNLLTPEIVAEELAGLGS